MRNKIGLLIGTLLFSQVSIGAFKDAPPSAPPFSGIFGNFNIGWMFADIENQQYSAYDTSLFTLASSPTLRNNSVTGGVGLGYSYVFNQMFVLGFEGRGYFESLTTHYDNTLHESVADITFNAWSDVKLVNDYAFLIKLGAILQPNTLLYVLAGPAWGAFNLNSNANISIMTDLGVPLVGYAAAEESGFESGWQAAIGMEYMLTKNFSAGLEYTHADYGDLDFPSPVSAGVTIGGVTIPGAVITNSAKFNAETNSIVLKINYYLG